MGSRKGIALLGAACLVMTLIYQGGIAGAAPATLNVSVGAGLDIGGGHVAASMLFFPDSVTVHKGDTLIFHGGFHTATALPVGTDADSWLATNDNAIGQPYFLYAPDSDEPGTYVRNPTVFRGDANGCKQTAPASYDGSSVVNSGALFNCSDFSTQPPTDHGFSMTVNVNPGNSFWVLCTIHPDMRLHVTVAANSQDATSPDQIDAAKTSQVSSDTQTAAALWSQLDSGRSSTTSGGTRVVNAFAGFSTDHLELFGMFPSVLHIRKGTTVRWHFSDLHLVDHSVVFNDAKAIAIATGLPPACESPNGDVPANSDGTCPAGSTGPPETEVPAGLYTPAGDGKVTSRSDYENSGARGGIYGAAFGNGSSSFDLTFPRLSPKSGFKYACGVHGGQMPGVVKVHA